MRFEWDEFKRRAVKRKHGIDLAEVPRIFLRLYVEDFDLSHSSSEDRWRALGLPGDRVVVVIYAHRGDAIRLISARYAEPHEEQKYFEEAFGEPW